MQWSVVSRGPDEHRMIEVVILLQIQRRQSGLKSGGVVEPDQKISIFSGNFTKKRSIFQGKFPKNFNFCQVISQKISIFLKANFRRISIF